VSGPEAKWDRIYKARNADNLSRVDEALLRVRELIPKDGVALDVAGGDGRNAVWLAKNGLDVTLIDVSSEALKRALEMAERSGVVLDVEKTDLEVTDPKQGPWDLVIIFNYCEKRLYKKISGILKPGGIVVITQATVKNLERHSSPSPRFLLGDGELTELLPELTVLLRDTGWRANGRHEVTYVAKRPN